jgi:hypothetical protein
MDHEGTPGSPRDDERSPSGGADSRIQSGLGSNSKESSTDPAHSKAEVIPIRRATTTTTEQPEEDDDPPVPVWMQRANIVMKFLICVWLGMVISVLPWTSVWTDNSLIMSLPRIRAIMSLNFVRGMVTGVGLIDIWIGIWEAVHYRDQRPAPRAPTS